MNIGHYFHVKKYSPLVYTWTMAAGDVDFLSEQFPDNVSISDLCDCG